MMLQKRTTLNKLLHNSGLKEEKIFKTELVRSKIKLSFDLALNYKIMMPKCLYFTARVETITLFPFGYRYLMTS